MAIGVNLFLLVLCCAYLDVLAVGDSVGTSKHAQHSNPMQFYGNSSSELKQFSLGGDVLQPVTAAAQHTVVYQLNSFSAGYAVAPRTSTMATGVTSEVPGCRSVQCILHFWT